MDENPPSGDLPLRPPDLRPLQDEVAPERDPGDDVHMSPRVPDSDLLHPAFSERRSTRSFTDEAVTDDEIAAIFEAARWSASWMNNQPWYYLYETDGPDRQAFLDVFLESNRDWARRAPLVGLVLARTELGDFMDRTRDFDVGMATAAMVHQAHLLGLSTHLLGGIDLDAAHELTGTDPDTTKIICGFVIGHGGDGSELPEKLRERETPSDRKPVSAFAVRGTRLPDA